MVEATRKNVKVMWFVEINQKISLEMSFKASKHDATAGRVIAL